MGTILPELHPAAVGCHDLHYNVQPQHMGSRTFCRKARQHREDIGRVTAAVVGDGDSQRLPFLPGLHLDGTARVMPGTVAQQIGKCPPKKGFVHIQRQALGPGVQVKIQGAGLPRPGIAEIGDSPAQQFPGTHRCPAQGLGVVLQFTGQVQVLDQAADGLPLGTYRRRPGPLVRRKSLIVFQLFGVAENQGQRRADIVADPGDPVSAGSVPPGDDLILALQACAGLVQFAGHLGGKAGGRQFHRATGCQRIQTVGHTGQGFGSPPAEHHAPRCDQSHQRHQCGQKTVVDSPE